MLLICPPIGLTGDGLALVIRNLGLFMVSAFGLNSAAGNFHEGTVS